MVRGRLRESGTTWRKEADVSARDVLVLLVGSQEAVISHQEECGSCPLELCAFGEQLALRLAEAHLTALAYLDNVPPPSLPLAS